MLKLHVFIQTEWLHLIITGLETCEACGKPGTVRGGGWIYCACDKCEEKYKQGKRAWRHPEEFPDIYEQFFGNSDPVG